MVGLIAKAAVALIGCLIAGDIAGVIFLVFVEILPFEVFSTPLTYVVWFVFGIFTGLSAFSVGGAWGTAKAERGGDWTDLPNARQTGLVVVITQAIVIAGLSYLFDRLYWSQGVSGEYYVPDSAPHSITYFISVLGAIIAAQFTLTPTTPDKPRRRVRRTGLSGLRIPSRSSKRDQAPGPERPDA